jgi:hypothetical protein
MVNVFKIESYDIISSPGFSQARMIVPTQILRTKKIESLMKKLKYCSDSK